jgi:hypothetical protein
VQAWDDWLWAEPARVAKEQAERARQLESALQSRLGIELAKGNLVGPATTDGICSCPRADRRARAGAAGRRRARRATEIDMAATLRAKLGVEIAPRGHRACRPELVHWWSQRSMTRPAGWGVRSVGDVNQAISRPRTRPKGVLWPCGIKQDGPDHQHMKKVLLTLHKPVYGADESSDAIRLANAPTRRDDTEVTMFLMGDAVTCTIAGQETPDGCYTLDRMLTISPGTAGTSPVAAPAWTQAGSPRSTSSRRLLGPPSRSWRHGPCKPTRSSPSDAHPNIGRLTRRRRASRTGAQR